MEIIDGKPSLEVIAAASPCDNDDNLLSRAASQKMYRLMAQTVANQSARFDDRVCIVSCRGYALSVSTFAK